MSPIAAGQVYRLDDYTYVEVAAVTAVSVIYRLRRGSSLLGRRQRAMDPDAFRRRVRAEVDGAFFP